jgi:hypothetical protein
MPAQSIAAWLHETKASLTRLAHRLNAAGEFETAAAAQVALIRLDELDDQVHQVGQEEEPLP